MHREVNGGSGFQSMDDLRVEFGLGSAATEAEEITIRWPSGCVQILADVPGDQVHEVIESCVIDNILREALVVPVGPMFPLPDYDPAPPTPPWQDPLSVLDDPGSFFFQHARPLTIHMVKVGRTVQMSW